MRSFCVLIVYFYLLSQMDSKDLQIKHYNKITLPSCGLNTMFGTSVKRNKCFKWHKTIIEEMEEMKAIHRGSYAKIGQFPYNVLITLKSRKDGWKTAAACSGSIINELWIITAAHCLLRNTASEYRVYSGLVSYYVGDNEPFNNVEKFIKHEDYLKDKIYNDIALIKLSSKINLNKLQTNSVCLPSYGFSVNDTEFAMFSGWGLQDRWDDDWDKRLRFAKMNLMPDVFINQTSSVLAAHRLQPEDATACNSDSGGPLVQYVNGRAVLIGTLKGTVNGTECMDNNGTLFIAISEKLEWIKQTILNNL